MKHCFFFKLHQLWTHVWNTFWNETQQYIRSCSCYCGKKGSLPACVVSSSLPLTKNSKSLISIWFIPCRFHWFIVLFWPQSSSASEKCLMNKKRNLHWISCHNIIIRGDSLEPLHWLNEWWADTGEINMKVSVFHWHAVVYACVSPSSSDYSKLARW